MQHRILLTGANGQVGWELRRTLSLLGQVVALDRKQLDLTDPDTIRRWARELRPTIVVNPAAYTAVDKAENEPELAMAINGIAPGILAEETKRLGALLVHYSTDYVFDGSKSAAYVETDSTNPLGVYGRTKLAGEQAIQTVGCVHLIFRTSWIYGLRGNNFFLTILRLAKEREHLRVVADQFGTPTWSHSVANATASVLAHWNHEENGVYHMTCSGATRWHVFAQAILQEYQATQAEKGWPLLRAGPQAVQAITSAEYQTLAKRPENSVLNNAKLGETFGLALPDWSKTLGRAMNDPVSQSN